MLEFLKNKVLGGEKLSHSEAVALSRTDNKEDLYAAANQIRKKFCGASMELCSISSIKSNNCAAYCKSFSESIRHSADTETYSIADSKQMLQNALKNASKGVKCHSLVINKQKTSDDTLRLLMSVYKQISETTNMELCASMGIVSKMQLKRLQQEANISHYHCNLEAAPSFFETECATNTLNEKIETIKNAQKLGMNVCSGGTFGMGESMEQRIELAILLRELQIKSIPINVFIPEADTALVPSTLMSEEEILTTIALFRFINPDAKLRFASGRSRMKAFQDKALAAGINAALTDDYLSSTGSDIDTDLDNFTRCGYTINNYSKKEQVLV